MIHTKHDCAEELRDVDLRATPIRIAILKFLERSDSPLDVSTIRDYLDKHNIQADPVTIFRIMNSFTRRGLTRQLNFNEGKARYELASSEHHHLICEDCGRVEDFTFEESKLLEGVAMRSGFKIKTHNLEIFGICQRCQN